MLHQDNVVSITLFTFVITVVIETLVLLRQLSSQHSLNRRLFAGFWLTSCTYPIVMLVLPFLFDPISFRFQYQLVAELFAAGCECALFWFAFNKNADSRSIVRDTRTVILANLLSYSSGILVSPLLGMIFPT